MESRILVRNFRVGKKMTATILTLQSAMKTTSTLLIFLILGLLLGCGNQDQTDNENRPGMKWNFLALGDSYTIGEGVDEDERWPVLLAGRLTELGVEVGPPQIIARTGWTTTELGAGIAEADPNGPFELVSLLIGVNNQYRGPQRGYTLEGYREEFAALLQQAIGFAGGDPGRVLVVSIPDYSVTPFVAPSDKDRVAGEIDAYNAVNASESAKAGVMYADITPISRLAAGQADLLAGDGLHPSGAMYALWVDEILPLLSDLAAVSKGGSE